MQCWQDGRRGQAAEDRPASMLLRLAVQIIRARELWYR